MTRLRVGACLSLTGRFGRFGRQAAEGLKVWLELAGDDVELEIEDDGSDPGRLGEALTRVAGRSDLLLGPYSTLLMREAARVTADTDAVLWNHGGAGDDVQGAWPGRIVSVLAPTSRYAMPFVRTRADAATRAPLWVIRGPGRFARQVAAGAVAEAQALGVEAVERKADGPGSFDHAPADWDLFSVGTFEDDVEIVNAARSAARPPRDICSIAAGVSDFAVNGRAAARHLRHRAMVRRLRPTSRARACCRRLRSGIFEIRRHPAGLSGATSSRGRRDRHTLRSARRKRRTRRAVGGCRRA